MMMIYASDVCQSLNSLTAGAYGFLEQEEEARDMGWELIVAPTSTVC